MEIAEILKKAKPPETTVDLCLAADLAAEHDELNRQLEAAQQAESSQARKMADPAGGSADIARQIRDLEERMQSEVVKFRMRGVSAYRYQELLDAHPAREDKQERWNPVSFPAALIAACAVEPAMSEEQARQLTEALGLGQTDRLFSAALQVTEGRGAVPFSVRASATLRVSEPAPK